MKWEEKAPSIDLNLKLLLMFDAIYHARSISAAAEELGLSQPGVSIGLSKLRRHFGDVLFVRSPTGMDPTPHAQHIAPLVQQALELLDGALSFRSNFDPAGAARTFRVCMTDVTQVLLLPSLLRYIAAEAPLCEIDVLRLAPDTPRRLASGEADVAIGLIPGLGADYREQILVKRSFACIASAAHPRIGRTMTLAQFESEPQVVIEADFTGLRQAENQLRRRKGPRNVRLRVPDFVGLEALIAESDMIATVPREVGERMALRGAVKVIDHPVRIPSYMAKQYWHQRFNRDPGNAWLRAVLRELLLPCT